MELSDDEALLRRIAEKDEQAFAMLYDRHGKLAYSLAYRILGPGKDAEDVVQDAFLNVWRMARSFDSRRGNARAWLLSVVRHRALDVGRRRRLDMLSASLLKEFPAGPAAEMDTWRTVSNNLDRSAINQALRQLPDEQRRAIELAYFGGYTQREIAELTQAPLGTVKGRIRIAMTKLRGLLENLEPGN